MSAPTDTPPTWVDIAGYTFEKIHTNVLARALKSGTYAANELAVALWELASKEVIPPGEITSLAAVCEQALGRGTHSVVDLSLEFIWAGVPRRLAIEVKVDGAPNGAQLASMAKALELGPNRRLVLLTVGGAQACRIEAEHNLQDLQLPIPRWAVKDMLALGGRIKAASPAPLVTQDWLTELELEERRRTQAYDADAASHGYRGRGRILEIYRYALAAQDLAPKGGTWNVSDQQFGVVMTERSHHHVIHKGQKISVYLQMVGGVLRVKAGAWEGPADSRAATLAVLSPIRAAMEHHGFKVEAAKQTQGRSVSLLSIDPHDNSLSREPLVQRLRRAYEAWSSIAWPK